MLVAYRLHKTVSELLRECTAREIADWLEYFEIADAKE